MDNEMDLNPENTTSAKNGRRNIYRPHCYKRQDSWTEFKGRIFKMASTVVLPRNRRYTRTTIGDASMIKTPTLSIKSLPQIRRDDEAQLPMRSKIYMRSISEQNAPRHHLQSSFSPTPHKRVLFAPRALPIDEAEEKSCSLTSSSSSAESLDKRRNMATEELSLPLSSELLPKFKSALRDPNSTLFGEGLRLSKHESSSRETSQSESASQHLFHEMSRVKEDQYDEDDDVSLEYHDFYNCMPPPIFMLCITLAEIGFFIYHTIRLLNDPNYGYVSKFSPAPLDSTLIYDPTRRFEVWRYITYAFVHSGYMHLINNVVMQLVLGILLEMVHKWWRVLAIYFAGVLAGSLATSIAEPFNFLAGASAGVYALITAHVSTVILNWTEMEHPWIRVLVFLAFVAHDGGTAIYYGYVIGVKTNVGYAAHLGGAVAGLLVGIHVLKNLQWRKWETILWWLCIIICILLFLFAVAWNIFRTDLFPNSNIQY